MSDLMNQLNETVAYIKSKITSEATTGISTFEKKDIRVKDVTEEFLDVEARLKTP